MSIRLYVGNLPKEDVDRQELHALFAEADDSVSTKVIKDRKTGKCRGFAFVTVPTDEKADELVEKFNGFMFQDSPLKVEKALPRSKSDEEQESAPRAATNSVPNRRTGGASGGGGKKPRRGATATTSSNDTGSIQPDPRWADDLAKLKEILATQASNP
jgi:RNA recognition motif-containing protein